jgi:hypothetical protein
MDANAGSRSIAEIVGVLGVIGSLVFVGVEIRQNTAAVRSATIMHVSDQAMSLGLALAGDDTLARLYTEAMQGRSLDSFGAEDRTRYLVLVNAGLRRVENVFLQVEAGVLEASSLRQVGIPFYQERAARDVWEVVRSGFDPAFASYWDEALGPS